MRQVAIPMAKPKILMVEKVLFRTKFLHAILKIIFEHKYEV